MAGHAGDRCALDGRADLRVARAGFRAAQHAIARAQPISISSAPRRDDARLAGRSSWSELHRRFETDDGWMLREGPIIDKSVTTMRSVVVQPMQHGRLFLAGDAAHIVPPTGAKGLNLAPCRRAHACGRARRSDIGPAALPCSTRTPTMRLARVWQVQHFSSWMTTLLHVPPDDRGGFQHGSSRRSCAISRARARRRRRWPSDTWGWRARDSAPESHAPDLSGGSRDELELSPLVVG